MVFSSGTHSSDFECVRTDDLAIVVSRTDQTDRSAVYSVRLLRVKGEKSAVNLKTKFRINSPNRRIDA